MARRKYPKYSREQKGLDDFIKEIKKAKEEDEYEYEYEDEE